MKTLLHFKDFCDELRLSNSRKHKQEVLQKYKNDEVVQRYLRIAFDPYVVYGISFKKLFKMIPVYLEDWHAAPVFELFDYLAKFNTGRDRDVLVCQQVLDAVSSVDSGAAALLEALICKDLSIGCDVKTINSVMPGLIPTFDVQLAQKYFERPERVVGKEFAITTKIDGGRIIAIKEEGQVSFFTRAGQRYEGLVDLEAEMRTQLPDNYVLDGEITLLDYQKYDSKTAYKHAMKITRADGPKHGVKMLVFDGMPLAEWKSQHSTHTWTERRRLLNSMAGFYLNSLVYFELLPVLYQGTDTSKILELLDSEIARGQEGVMINMCDAVYEFGRTWSLMKVKKMNTLDLEIVGYEEGSGRLSGTLGAFHVRYKDNNIVKVGSGLSEALRVHVWQNPGAFVGRIAEIQYFEETSNAEGGVSLRFPVFKDFRPDKLTPDF